MRPLTSPRVLETGIIFVNAFHKTKCDVLFCEATHELRTSNIALKVMDMTFCGVFSVPL